MKPFSWSFSRLKSFETCPKKHYECDIQRNYKEEGDYLKWGNEVHKALEVAIANGVALPPELQPYQKFVGSIRKANGIVEVEKQFALDADFRPCPYFGNNVWYRGKADVVIRQGQKAFAYDWKTGRVEKDSVQLMLMAQCIFSHYPEVQEIHTAFVWLKHLDNEPHYEVYSRVDIANAWIGLSHRVAQMQAAYETQSYPPKPSGLCRRHCPVVSCPFHGKGAR